MSQAIKNVIVIGVRFRVSPHLFLYLNHTIGKWESRRSHTSGSARLFSLYCFRPQPGDEQCDLSAGYPGAQDRLL